MPASGVGGGVPEPHVGAARADEGLVGSGLDDATVVEDDDLVGGDDIGQPVGDEQDGALPGQFADRALEVAFVLRVLGTRVRRLCGSLAMISSTPASRIAEASSASDTMSHQPVICRARFSASCLL
jgi:hypothetical protein